MIKTTPPYNNLYSTTNNFIKSIFQKQPCIIVSIHYWISMCLKLNNNHTCFPLPCLIHWSGISLQSRRPFLRFPFFENSCTKQLESSLLEELRVAITLHSLLEWPSKSKLKNSIKPYRLHYILRHIYYTTMQIWSIVWAKKSI